MRIHKKFVALGCACFLVFLVTTFPARTVFALFLPDEVQAFGVNGSIWNGSARIINAGGMQIRNTEWQIAVGNLLLGRLGGDFKTRWGGGFAEGTASVSAAGTVRVTNTRSTLDAAILTSLFRVPQINGSVSLEVKELELADNWPTTLTGRGEIFNLSSPLMGRGNAALIGNVAIEFDSSAETAADTLTGHLSNKGGPLRVKGTLILTPPGNYDLDTRIRAKRDAPESLRNNLQFLGSPDEDGYQVFKLAGSI